MTDPVTPEQPYPEAEDWKQAFLEMERSRDSLAAQLEDALAKLAVAEGEYERHQQTKARVRELEGALRLALSYFKQELSRTLGNRNDAP